MEPQFLTVGYVQKPKGKGGKVCIEMLTDFPSRFESGSVLFLTPPHKKFKCLTIESANQKEKKIIVKFKEVGNLEEAYGIKGSYLQTKFSEAPPLPGDTYWQHQILGLTVHTSGGRELGEIVEILRTGGNDVYVVEGSYGEILIPATKEVIKKVDVGNNIMIIESIPGLLEI